jgi:hypothetical protein
MSTAMGSAGHGEEEKHEEKVTFSASNSLKLLYLRQHWPDQENSN